MFWETKRYVWVRNQRWASSEWDQFHLCHSHLLRRQVTAAHRQILENWQYIRSQFFSSVKLSNTLLHFVLLTSPLFRMRVIMWHGSDGRRKDTKNRFWWHLRKSEKKKSFVSKRLVESILWNGEASRACEESQQLEHHQCCQVLLNILGQLTYHWYYQNISEDISIPPY